MKVIQITFDERSLKELDATEEVRRDGRSAVLRRAVRDEGVKRASAANLDHVQTVEKARLRKFVGTLSHEKMNAVCNALAVATGCAGG